MSVSTPSGNRQRGWVRGLRPLLWWLLLVLVLYGIRLNEQLLEQTRLFYSLSLNGQPLPYDVAITFDGRPIRSGENIPLGNHRFEIAGQNTDPFATNLSIWYGRHDLGEIRLKRSTGTLSVSAYPAAQVIAINGPEYSTNLTNSSGAILTVPTGSYTVSVQYPHWWNSQKVSVNRDTSSPVTFSPNFGALRLTCNKGDATYRLVSANGQPVDSGSLPAVAGELPTGNYELTVWYHSRQMQQSAVVEAGVTNEVATEFVYGAVQFETVPSGAQVLKLNGNYLGQTPLLLSDQTPQTTQFNLSLSGYEPVSVTLEIAADQTNVCHTNLVSIGYVSAMREARTYLVASNYASAVQAASAALNSKPDDTDALALLNQAKDRLNTERQRLDQLTRPKRVFDSLCQHYQDAGLFTEHEFKTSKPAKELAVVIVNSLTNGVGAFQILYNDSPETQAYEVVAQRTFSLGILGGTERDCLLVIGQAKDDETQIWFKVLEYQVQHTVTSNGLLNYHDNKQLTAVSPSRMQMNDFLSARVQEGVQIVAGKIQNAIGQ
jgi:hypothetical protein